MTLWLAAFQTFDFTRLLHKHFRASDYELEILQKQKRFWMPINEQISEKLRVEDGFGPLDIFL